VIPGRRFLCALAVLMQVVTPVLAYVPAPATPDFSALCTALHPAAAQGKSAAPADGIAAGYAGHCVACSAALAAPLAATAGPVVGLAPVRAAPAGVAHDAIRVVCIALPPARAPPIVA
jgi:hypothetical protein